jgi:hypothetical protein
MPSTTSTQDRHVFWNNHVQAYRASGLSKARYCRYHNVTYQQFIYWATKFDDTTKSDNTLSAPSPSKLVPVVLSEPAYPSGLQLHLPNGVLISGICAQSVGMIGDLIEQL